MNSAAAGVLLAGGQSRRMGGGDKCLRSLAGKSILAHVIERIAPQVQALVLNANGDPARFQKYRLPVVPDAVGGFAGPLAGVLTGMKWVRDNRPDVSWLVSVPTDAPFLPRDLVARLFEAIETEDGEMACARSGGRAHPVVGLWPVSLANELHAAMMDEAIRKVDVWTGRYRLIQVDFSVDPVDPFFNANRPEDVAVAERILAGIRAPEASGR